jgi:hypothetical protein
LDHTEPGLGRGCRVRQFAQLAYVTAPPTPVRTDQREVSIRKIVRRGGAITALTLPCPSLVKPQCGKRDRPAGAGYAGCGLQSTEGTVTGVGHGIAMATAWPRKATKGENGFKMKFQGASKRNSLISFSRAANPAMISSKIGIVPKSMGCIL